MLLCSQRAASVRNVQVFWRNANERLAASSRYAADTLDTTKRQYPLTNYHSQVAPCHKALHIIRLLVGSIVALIFTSHTLTCIPSPGHRHARDS
jgi:hypothetical protein